MKSDTFERGFAERLVECFSGKALEEMIFDALIAAQQMAFQLAHEPARCGHARGNWKDPQWGTPEYQGNERCEACAAIDQAVAAEQRKAQGLVEALRTICEGRPKGIKGPARNVVQIATSALKAYTSDCAEK